MKVSIKVWRQKNPNSPGGFKTYTTPQLNGNMSFLEMLDVVNEDLAGKGEILLDPRGELHHRYGARSACLYVVRPDGYIGFRSQPPDAEALDSYFTRIFL